MKRSLKNPSIRMSVYALTAFFISFFLILDISASYAASNVPEKDAMSILIQETTVPGMEEQMNQNFMMERQGESVLDSFSNATKKKKKKTTRKSKTPKDTNLPDSQPVGPDIRGEWSGYVDLIGKERESVTANVYQNGNYVVITTTSHQKYGQKFIGNIKESGFILAYDQRTGEDWTTHSGPATANRIDLYDYVNTAKHGYSDLDRLLLTR